MFYVFSDEGVTILQPGECEIRRRIKHSERIVASYVSVRRLCQLSVSYVENTINTLDMQGMRRCDVLKEGNIVRIVCSLCGPPLKRMGIIPELNLFKSIHFH